ncbi:vacuolar protein sorting-associated protein 53, putative (VPS53) [Plasmodium malariae]|uniref:Vacuolar protein sorting-associated protein 53, putative (VPS53) n=1 Tax=Plasmodium malariae TaxID=5858 RepID=A0A1A8VSF4_PLAMA|nr:vacuolar protein sorting-associated protein 53, putative (VPS53) [Plasmodium malariae]
MKYLANSSTKIKLMEETKKIRSKKEEDEYVKDYINNNIKNIEDVEMHVEKMNKEIVELDKAINDKVENHVLSKNEYEEKLKSIKEKMKLINNKMEQVDKKTEESEDILIKLCKDIKKLDIGKKNVTETIIILKRIVMVITAISNLKKKALKRDYKDCISLVSVIKLMLTHISDLKTNNKLSSLYNDANILFDDLKHQIMEDIDLIYDSDVHIENNIVILSEFSYDSISFSNYSSINNLNSDIPSGSSNNRSSHNSSTHNSQSHNGLSNDKDKMNINLFDACNCLYHLNPNFVNSVAKKFTTFFLEKYVLIFENQVNTLESIDRRLAWLKRSLNNYENTYAHIFPRIYNIPYYIVSKFCSITKNHIVKIMSSSMEEMNPVSIIQTVIKVINFENFLTKNITFFTEENGVSYDSYSSLEFPFPELIIQKELTQMDCNKCANDDLNEHSHMKKSKESFLSFAMHNIIKNISKEGTNNKQIEEVEKKGKEAKFASGNTINYDMHEGAVKNDFPHNGRDVSKSTTPISIPIENTSNYSSNKIETNNNLVNSTKERSRCHAKVPNEQNGESREKEQKGQNFIGIISCVFDSYLCSWLKYEEKKILMKYENIISDENKEDIFDITRDNETKVQNFVKDTFDDIKNFLNKNKYIPEINFEIMGEKHTVYKSAYKIFYLYKSYVNMILLFSNCQTLYDFVMFFKTLLLKYSEELNTRTIKEIKEENKIQNFKLLSILINTSYYVEQTINEANENIIKDIDPIFMEKISLKDEEKLFLNIKTNCIKVIISYIQKKINNIISNNSIVNIYDINHLQEKSSYILEMENFLHKYFIFFKKIFNDTYLTYLFEKTTTLIIQQFHHTIFSFKFMTNITAQQLLLDCYEIQKVLLKIPLEASSKKKGPNDEKNRTAINDGEYTGNTMNENVDEYVGENVGENGGEKRKQQISIPSNMLTLNTDIDDCFIPQTYFNYVKKHMNKIELLIKIFLSNIYDMNSFNLLLTENNNICTIQEIEKILSLKENKGENIPNEINLHKNYVHDIKERGIKAAEEVKFFFNKITSI